MDGRCERYPFDLLFSTWPFRLISVLPVFLSFSLLRRREYPSMETR